MSLSICADCLSRLRISSKLPRSTAAFAAWTPSTSFSTTAAQYKSPLVKKKSQPQKTVDTRSRQSQSARLKKKTRDRPKLPPVGERRAQRRRIVLSNTNAISISDMETWNKETMSDDKYVGQMLALDGELLDQLRDSQAFKTTQNWSLFRRPATLIRQETLDLSVEMLQVEEEKKLVKHLVVGERASGKSVLMLQAMSMAYMNQWIVLNVPEAQALTNNTSSYTPIRQTDADPEQMYMQPHQTQLLLQRALASNEAVLKSLKVNHSHPSPISATPNKSTLHDLVQRGAEDFHLAWPTWQALYKELTTPGTNPRPAVLVAADGVDHWMGPTMYKNSAHQPIHAHQFALIRQFVNLLFSSTTEPSAATTTRDLINTTPFVGGGMILCCTSGSNSPAPPTLHLLLSQMRAAQNQHVSPSDPDFPLPKPYSKPDERVLALSPAATTPGNVNLLELKGLSKDESRAYLEYFAKSGIMHRRVTDGFVGEMRGLSGGGVVGELARLGASVAA